MTESCFARSDQTSSFQESVSSKQYIENGALQQPRMVYFNLRAKEFMGRRESNALIVQGNMDVARRRRIAAANTIRHVWRC